MYSWHQLQKHIRVGDKALNKDDDTGFKGHPECHFCKINFYGNDELFEHCRDKHEQCHICVREGVRHQYYENYNSLVGIEDIYMYLIKSLIIGYRKSTLRGIITCVFIGNVWIRSLLSLRQILI